MLRNYLTTAVRNFLRQPIYSIINLSGLVLGLTCNIFIFVWIFDEFNADSFHKDRDRIFQVLENEFYSNGNVVTYNGTRGPLAEKLKQELPEVEQSTRTSWSEQKLFTSGKQALYEKGVYADSMIFHLFTFKIISGAESHPLPDNNSVAISRTMAQRFFQDEIALGQSLRVGNMIDVKVTAVFDDQPENSEFDFDFVLPFNLYQINEHRTIDWDHANVQTYVKLRSRELKVNVENKISMLMHSQKGMTPSIPINSSSGFESLGEDAVTMFLFPMTDWRLYYDFERGKQTGGGRIVYVISFSLVALFILIIACINFMNLATARATRRSREIGIRKVVGSSRASLIWQFMTESILLSLLSLVIAILFAHILMPLFNYLTDKNLSIDYTNPIVVLSLLAIMLFTGLLAGSYPAFFISSFHPASVLKGNLFSGSKGGFLRKALVVVQFSMSVILIVCALTVNEQINYIRNKDLGYDKENVIFFRPQVSLYKSFESFRNELMKNPIIQNVAEGDSNPMEIFNNDFATWEGVPEDSPATVQTSGCDYDYLQVMGFSLKEGRNFSRDLASDSTSFIINEASARLMGFDQPIGQKLKVYKFNGKIIGVIKDFHNRDLRGDIDPVIFLLMKADVDNPMSIYVRYQPGKHESAVAYLRDVYKKFEPDFPLQYLFLDDVFERQYRSDIMMGHLAICFTLIAIFISSLGLFGLTLFSTEVRTKEIGVRKVLGASVPNLIQLLCVDFAKPVVIAIIFGSIPAYFLVNRFLDQYTFHTTLTGWVFVITAAILLIFSLFTVIYQSAKAANQNPVEALRNE